MLTESDRARRWAERNEAVRRMQAGEPVRRRIVASSTRNGKPGHDLTCGHWVPRLFGAIEYAQCGHCGLERAKRAGVR